MKKASVSVVIATYNRATSLRRTLDSLAQQMYPMDQFEVILVDDGSTDNTSAVSQERFPFALRYIYQINQGEHIARNLGAQHSLGEILAFLDDDIVVVPEYISSLVQEHKLYDRIVVLGTLRSYPVTGGSLFRRLYGLSDTAEEESEEGYTSFVNCTSGVLSIKLHHYFDVGMMQLLPGGGRNRWGGLDFAYRAHRAGFQFRRCTSAIAYHDDYAKEDLSASCQRWEKVSKAAVLLFQKYPDLQPDVAMFRDKTAISLQRDPPRLIIRKVLRALTAWRPVLWGMERLIYLLERIMPRPTLLRPLYRWTISSYIYRGYRHGLREYGPILTEG